MEWGGVTARGTNRLAVLLQPLPMAVRRLHLLGLQSCRIVPSLCADVTARSVQTSCSDDDVFILTAAAAAAPLSSQAEKKKA